MKDFLVVFLGTFPRLVHSRIALEAEILALRHQILVLRRTSHRLEIRQADQVFWSWLSHLWAGWQGALFFVQPETVIAWRRRKFREHWAKPSRGPKPGRPRVPARIRESIRRLSTANPLWGSPRIQGELGKLGIEVSKSTVERYMVRRTRPRSQGWITFLRNHRKDVVSIDFFTVSPARFKLLLVLVVLVHFRRKVVQFNVTEPVG